MYFITIFCYLLISIFIILFFKGNFSYFLNIPTIIVFLLVLIATLLGTKSLKDFYSGFLIATNKKKSYSLIELKKSVTAVEISQKITLLTGSLISLLKLISALHSLDDPASLGPIVSAIILSLLYSVVLIMLFTPITTILKGKIIAYMDDDENSENEIEDQSQRIFYHLRSLGLTDREAEVARLISTGMTNKEIGKELFITESTVKKHVTHILEKLHLNSREEISAIINK